jgi:hypothetical protein
MIVMGGVAAVRAQFPNVPLLAGEEEILISPDNEYNQQELPDYSGVEEFSGTHEFSGEEYVTAADI